MCQQSKRNIVKINMKSTEKLQVPVQLETLQKMLKIWTGKKYTFFEAGEGEHEDITVR